MIDKKGRLFGKVSVVDLFAVVVVAAVIAVVYFNVGVGSHRIVGAEQSILITFYNPALHNFTAEAVEVGAPIVDDINETFLGRVISVETGESINYLPDVNGIERVSSIEGYSSVEFTSRVDGRMSGGAVVLGGNVYGVGSEVIIWVGRAKTMLLISDIREEN